MEHRPEWIRVRKDLRVGRAVLAAPEVAVKTLVFL